MKIVAFGDSLTAEATYPVGGRHRSWYQMIQTGPFRHTGLFNMAVGGSISGAADTYAYQLDGVVLSATGMLGQIDLYTQVATSPEVTAVIWTGTNDAVVAAQLAPFTNATGTLVELAPDMQAALQQLINIGMTDLEIIKSVARGYTAQNIAQAILKLRIAGIQNIVVVGIIPLQKTPLGSKSKVLSTYATTVFTEEVQRVCGDSAVKFIDLSQLYTTCIDEIHLTEVAQKIVLSKLLEV